jgi:hypothetical protein
VLVIAALAAVIAARVGWMAWTTSVVWDHLNSAAADKGRPIQFIVRR